MLYIFYYSCYDLRNPSEKFPSTPERDRTAEREQSRIHRLNMTSTDERRSRSHSSTPPQGVPMPQPVFENQPDSFGASLRDLGHVAPIVGGQYPQAGYAGSASMQPQPVNDVFDVGLGGPPMAPALVSPHMSGVINLNDDTPQGQMPPVENAFRPQPQIPSHHMALHPVRSDPAFNNIHCGHIAHRGREATHRQFLLDQEFISLHQQEREAREWVIPDEQARHARNANRGRMHLPEEPPSQLHMEMSGEHEWCQQRIAALDPFCVLDRSTSLPAEQSSHQAREREARQQRIAELRTRREHNESRRAASAQARESRMAAPVKDREHEECQQRIAELRTWQEYNESRRAASSQAREHQEHETRMAQWNAQEEIRRREEELHQMQDEMRRTQAVEQELHQQRVAQIEAQRIQNEIRRAHNQDAAIERQEDEHLSQQAEQFQREEEAQAEAIHREQEERNRIEADAYGQVHGCPMSALPGSSLGC